MATPLYINRKRAASPLPPSLLGAHAPALDSQSPAPQPPAAGARSALKPSLLARSAAPAQAARVFFGRAPVDRVTMSSATEWLMRVLEGPRMVPHLIMGPNAFLVALAQSNPRFAEALAQASLCLPDGMSVVWASRLLGKPIPERVPGGEFMEAMCALLAKRGKSVYFLGGLPGAARQAADRLADGYPGLIVAGTDCPRHGFDQDGFTTQAVLDRIRDARPDLLFVAFGAPKQEIWMLEHCRNLPVGAVLSVGAAFDTTAGMRERAPAWTHEIGAEWLYRLAMEPRRLWRRYLIGNAAFGVIVAREWIKMRRQRATKRLLAPRPL